MSRLHEFITRIRNTKTAAEERAEYQKEMAVIRESFAKNEEAFRPRNVTKLLFINMSGQETNFGQMECLKLITANTLIEKRIGYLGLTQLFHEKSELLMMATNRIRVDLAHTNNNLVGLALCVLSEICTVELATQLHKEVLKCVNSSSKFIKKKAILASIKLLKKTPQFLSDFMPAIIESLDDKNHGVLLGAFAFLENALTIDENQVESIINLMPKISQIYRQVVGDYNTDYEISGVQDPFLQVTILRFLRSVKKLTNNPSFMKYYGQILVTSHDGVCAKISGGNIKNGANAILFQCFQCFMTIPPNPTLSTYTENVLTKFVSVKDSNSKYLSLFNLGLMAKHDLNVARRYKGTVVECLEENDILIRVMALDLLYLIASPENVSSIIKELLNVLLSATDEEFIAQLSLRICLIVEKYSQNRRWHFDTILKVLILADQSVKEDSAKSLVHLITITPELQQYCLAKLFFSACQNLRNDTLCKVTMYLLGELSKVLLRVREVKIQESNILDLIEQIVFRPVAASETIEYGLSALFKLYDKFAAEHRDRILKMIKSFESHSDLEVQKRACEYGKLLDAAWREERVKEICIPIPAMRAAANTFGSIPIGETQMDLQNDNLKMPQKLNINYDDHISAIKAGQQRQFRDGSQFRQQRIEQQPTPTPTITTGPSIIGQSQPQAQQSIVPPQPPQPQKTKSLLDDDDDDMPVQVPQQTGSQPTIQPVYQSQKSSDPFDILGLDIGGSTGSVQTTTTANNGGDLLGGFGGFSFGQTQPNLVSTQPTFTQPTFSQPQPVQNKGFDSLLDDGIFGGAPKQPTPTPTPIYTQPPTQPTNFGFDFLGTGSTPAPVNPMNNFLGQPTQPIPQPQQQFMAQTPTQAPPQSQNTFKFKAYETAHVQVWMQGKKEADGNTRVNASFMNKTHSYIEQLNFQTAVVKYLKIVAVHPMSGSSLPPNSKGAVSQMMMIANSALGQKPIVMKVKLSYFTNGEKFAFEDKVQGFPLGF